MSGIINIPKRFIQKTFVSWTDTYDDYDPTSYDVKYIFANTNNTISCSGTANGSSFDFEPDTTGFEAGTYQYQISATHKTNNRLFIIATGYVNITLNFDGTAGVDTRSDQEKILEQINNHLISNVASEKQKITYKDMEVWNYDRTGLLELRKTLMREISMMNELKKRREGRQTRMVRFKMS